MCTVVNMNHNNDFPQNMYFVLFVFLFGSFMYILLYLKENRKKMGFFVQIINYTFSNMNGILKIGLCVVSNESLLCIMTFSDFHVNKHENCCILLSIPVLFFYLPCSFAWCC